MTHTELMATYLEHMIRAGVPKDYARRVVEPLDATPAVKVLRAWWASGEPTKVLAGGNGCGKSIAAASIIREHCQDNSKRGFLHEPGDMLPWWVWGGCRWRDAERIASLSAFDPEDKAEAKALIATSLLIVDEAGNEKGQGESALGNLLADRMTNERTRTIVTTNLSAQNFATRYGARVMSRLGGIESISVVHTKDLRLVGRIDPDVTQPNALRPPAPPRPANGQNDVR